MATVRAPRKSWPDAASMGTIAARPTQHLLVYARAQTLTGSLWFDGGDGDTATIVFSRGLVHKVNAPGAGAHLGTVAYELGLIDARTLDDSLRAFSSGSGRRHGEILLAGGALTYAQLSVALMEQTLRKLTYLHGMSQDTLFAFHDHFDGLRTWPADGPRTDPLPAVWRGCRDFVAPEHLRDVLGRLGHGAWRLAKDAPLVEFGFDAETVAMASDLRQPMTVHDVLAQARGARGLAERMLYVLAITKNIEHAAATDEAQSPTPPRAKLDSGTYQRLISFDLQTPFVGKPGSAPAPPEPALLPPTRIEIIERARTIAAESAYEVLRVAETASDEVIRAAYFRLSRAWRPERLPPELADVREACGIVREHMDGAHRTLTDPDLRAVYDARPR
jgi:DnaJ domain